MKPLDRASHEAQGQAALDDLRQGRRAPMAEWLRRHLFDHVMPFWEPLIDDDHGGLFTCVADGGDVVVRDKWLWSQWRAVWVYARIYNTLDRDPRWLKRAVDIARFCERHGWLDKEAGWALLLADNGKVKRGYESVYVDAFAVYGMGELAIATGEEHWVRRARETADAAVARIDTLAHHLPHFPYPISTGTKPHGLPMIWSLKLAALARVTGEKKYEALSRAALREIDRDFYDAADDRIFETVRRGECDLTSPVLDVTVPGHVIESLWFRRLIAAEFPDTDVDVSETWRRMARHFELGWDDLRGGGLLLAVDGHGPAPQEGWPFGDMKLWWPHTEALFASLLGWHETGAEAWLAWYERLWRFVWQHYVDWEHGEWRQKLNRDLTPFTGTIALPVKDPFHLPRSLILQIELLERGRPPRVVG